VGAIGPLIRIVIEPRSGVGIVCPIR